MKINQTFSILIWANKSKSADNEIPLYARLTVNGQRSETSLKKKVHSSLWNPSSSSVKVQKTPGP